MKNGKECLVLEHIRLIELAKRRMSLIFVSILLAVVTSGAVCMLIPVQYQAKAVLWLGQNVSQTQMHSGTRNGAEMTPLDYNSLMMYRQLARTYLELATSEPVLSKLSTYVQQDLSTAELRNMVTVRKVKDLELLEILVLDTSPERAAYIANRLAAILQQQEKDLWKMSSLRVISPAVPDGRPAGPDIPLYLLTSGLAALFLSLLAAAAMDYSTGERR